MGQRVASLKGSGRKVIYSALRREYWPPAHRIGFGIGGLMLVLNSMRGRGISSFLGITVGSVLLTRATLNRNIQRILGMGVGPDVISVQKTVNFKAPVATVYELWRCPEKFPSFMRNVRHVERHNNSKHHWVVKGPAGIDVLFGTEMTEQRENKRISWRSVPGSMVSHRGTAYFEDHGDATTVHLHMWYNPPLGYLGHFVAFGLHADPCSRICSRLTCFATRFKSIESHVSKRAEGVPVNGFTVAVICFPPLKRFSKLSCHERPIGRWPAFTSGNV